MWYLDLNAIHVKSDKSTKTWLAAEPVEQSYTLARVLG